MSDEHSSPQNESSDSGPKVTSESEVKPESDANVVKLADLKAEEGIESEI